MNSASQGLPRRIHRRRGATTRSQGTPSGHNVPTTGLYEHMFEVHVQHVIRERYSTPTTRAKLSKTPGFPQVRCPGPEQRDNADNSSSM
ncbi:hypothetical protein Asera_60380 [Actinocatenispora sera]|uniref:Uncharacterized protein n=1 Tax=Actinocatenispora sera TaxID=390989 RepID=A0A810L8R5_9ACTN|nr:hypothetical protein Asera_60380 [Actinocatenispora sera]